MNHKHLNNLENKKKKNTKGNKMCQYQIDAPQRTMCLRCAYVNCTILVTNLYCTLSTSLADFD